jgi:hypothetical protein
MHQAAPRVQAAAKALPVLRKYKKPLVITLSVIVLQLIFGFDAKFCIINIIWLFV